jgi:hypothetical protein
MIEMAPPAEAAEAPAPPAPSAVVADAAMPVDADIADRRNLSRAMASPEIAAPTAVVDNPYGLAAVAGGSFKSLIGSVDQRYAPGTLVQAGPGIPKWRYRMYAYEWSGPVDATQSVRFIFIGPVLLGIWRFVGIALLGVLFLALLASGNRGGTSPLNLSELFGRSTSRAVAPLVLVALASLLAVGAPSRAQATPDAELLEQLKTRLTSDPQCAPTCAEITSAQVTARGERLDVSLQISALTAVAVPVPSAGDRWQLDTITLDGRSTRRRKSVSSPRSGVCAGSSRRTSTGCCSPR